MVSNPSWIFEQLPPGTGDVEPLNSEFFPSGTRRDVCQNLVRECTQNAIDEALTTLTETGAEYQNGVRVNHGTFGLGTVQSVKPDNGDFILTIRFDGEDEPRHLLQNSAENGSNLRPVTSDRKVFLKYQFGNRDGRAQPLTGRRTRKRAELIRYLPNTIDVPPVDEGRAWSLPVRWLEDDDIITDDLNRTSVPALG